MAKCSLHSTGTLRSRRENLPSCSLSQLCVSFLLPCCANFKDGRLPLLGSCKMTRHCLCAVSSSQTAIGSVRMGMLERKKTPNTVVNLIGALLFSAKDSFSHATAVAASPDGNQPKQTLSSSKKDPGLSSLPVPLGLAGRGAFFFL